MANVTFFFTIREVKSRRANEELQVERIARNIATMQLVDRLDWSIYQNYITQLTAVNDDIVYIAIYDDRQYLRAHALNANLVDIGKSEPLSQRQQGEIVRRLDEGAVAQESQEDIRTQTVNIQSGDRVLGSVHVGFSLIEINDELRHGIIRTILMAVTFLVIFGTVSILLSRRLTKPIEHLSAAMDEVKAGNLDQEVAIENRDEIGQLAMDFNEMVEGLRERRTIESLGRELGATFQLERLASLVRERLSGAIGAAGAALFLRDRKEGDRYSEVTEGSAQSATLTLDKQARSYLLEKPDGFVLESSPETVQKAVSLNSGKGNGLVIPMLVKGNLFGMLIFDIHKGENGINPKRQHFAAILANQAALALENSLLYDDLREQERLKHELEIARTVQMKLLPGDIPAIRGFQIDSSCLPAHEVGGDYYDVFFLDKNQVGIAIADVSGKGTSAAFYMAEIKGMMLSLTAVHRSPKKLLVELNRQLYRNLERQQFASMIYGVLELKSRRFVFARAGHNSLLYIPAKGHCDLITPSGIGLGLDSGKVFEKELEEVELPLASGDTFVLYTDGLTDAMNIDREEYGEDRLIQSASEKRHCDATDIRGHILENIQNHVNGNNPHDDLTMVVVKHQENSVR